MKGYSRIKLAVTTAVLILAAGMLYGQFWIPNKQIMDTEWLDTATRSEIREVCHQVLRFPVGNHHDAFIYLMGTGDKSSVPILIRALKWNEPDGDFIVCTTKHCVDALYSLTGMKMGNHHSAWKHWWKITGRHQPETFFGSGDGLMVHPDHHRPPR